MPAIKGCVIPENLKQTGDASQDEKGDEMEMDGRALIQTAQSCAPEARDAVREFHAAIAQPDMALVVFFCSHEYDLDALADEMRRLFSGVQVVGCTTAGEIGPAGYRDNSLVGASFPAASFHAVSGAIQCLRQFDSATGGALVADLLGRLEKLAPQAGAANSFAMLLIDGLSLREEPVTLALQKALGALPLIGGSAGDGLRFGGACVYFEGSFHTDSAVLTLVTTQLPFKLFKTQHFVATDERMVVTEADAAHRIVTEINGLPAAPEYARILRMDVRDLDPNRFADSPVVVLIDGAPYVRSIQKANPDGSLTFFCAIERGLILRVAKGIDLLADLEQVFTQMRAEIGAPQFVLGYDCVLRKLDLTSQLLKDRAAEIFRRNNAIGFNTYGEQFNGLHVNQTLIGIAIGAGQTETEHA
jgi:hypothetical protein